MPNKEGLWCPDNCPITGLAFFMWLSHPDLGYVPTYGGPLDSYTLATVDEDGDIRSERYDHDEGDWVEGGEPMRASRKLTDAIDNYTPPAPDARDIPGLMSMSARAGTVTLRFESESAAQRFIRTYHPTVQLPDEGQEDAVPGEGSHHAALQRIGTALGLLAGSDLHRACVPVIERLKASAKQAAPVAWCITMETARALAAELVRGAESMGDDESELILEVRHPGTVADDDGKLNDRPILAIALAEYPEEGVYPIDPVDPTGGRVDAAPEPAAPVKPFPSLTETIAHARALANCQPSAARKQSIARAVAAWGGVWPAQLESGVMFYEGERITRDDFEAAQRARKEPSNG